MPDVFLRGCGLPDDYITYIGSLVANPIEFYSCFISYSHADRAFARRLHDGLQSRGVRCWMDEHQLLPGDKILDCVHEGIRLSDKVLLCCSKDSLKSVWVEDEIEKAIQKEKQLRGKKRKGPLAITPLNLDGNLLTAYYRSGHKSFLVSRLAADFKGWERNGVFEKQIEKVVNALRADEGARLKPPKPKLGCEDLQV